MSKRKKTADELARSSAAGVAKRFNREQAERAPLLAWAGLTPTITADEAYQRRIDVQSNSWWSGVERDYSDSTFGFLADWHRYIVWSLVDETTFSAVAAWADHVRGPVYCRLNAWRIASKRIIADEDPLPESAIVHPSACWPAYRRAINERRWTEERMAHEAAGCSTQRCNVLHRDRPPPLTLGSMTLAQYEAEYP